MKISLHLQSEGVATATELISPLVLASWSFASVFLYCEFGASVTTEFAKFDDELYQSKWYSLPVEIQKMMMIFIASTQKPVFIRGFCNIVCIRDSFKKVHGFFFSASKWQKITSVTFIHFRRFMRDFHTSWHFSKSAVKLLSYCIW